MKRIIKILGVGCAFAFVIVAFLFGWMLKHDPSVKENITVLNFEQSGQQLFVKTKVWGVAGNHEEIVLSKDPNGVANKEEDCIFYTSEIFYRIEGEDSLILYAPENLASIPPSKNTSVTLVLHDLPTAGELEDMRRNYKSYGLEMVSVYSQD